MRRKSKNRRVLQKKPVFVPFVETDSDHMIPLGEDYKCVSDKENDIENMDLYDLRELEDELVESIADYDTIIELELDGSGIGFDQESLRMDRQRRQKLVVELRAVRAKIKMLKYGNKEVAIAV